MAYFILSLDGGGIRGALSAALLGAIERKTPFLNKVDLFAGTSTGGILALGLARGLPPQKLLELYTKRGKEIFSSRDLLDTLSGGSDELYRADYGKEKLKQVLQEELGAGTLGQLQKRVLISSFDLESETNHMWKAKFFHNYEVAGNDRDQSIVDVALRTSAAPTYFPSHQGYIDGGVVANNPAVCAIAKAVKTGVGLDQIRLLSIGTGFNPHHISGNEHDWGKVQWGTRILELVMDGALDVPDYQCRQLLERQNYHRLQVQLPKPIKLDGVDQVPDLLALLQTQKVIEQVAAAANFVS